ncbi:Whi5 like protein [Ceratocystis lukuohia]|uniref:Whi5 like protein n=1 Tax=Ceratocystis lukuohia TaxID=2019550 RepID=A0ABR4MDT6_9PEZI
METPSKRRALGLLDANVNASPRSPIKSLKTPASDIRKRPFDNIPSLPTPSKRACLHKMSTAANGLQPSPILSKFSLNDTELDLPPAGPSLGLGMTSFDSSPDASRAFMTACASSPTVSLPRARSRTMSRQETRQKADALRLRLGLANYKLRTGQADVPLDKLQMRPCRLFRHSISFPNPRSPPTFAAMAATARKALGHMSTSTSAMMSSSPVQPSPLRERQHRVAAAAIAPDVTATTPPRASAIAPRQVQLPTPMPSQEERQERQRQLQKQKQKQQPQLLRQTPLQMPKMELTGDETESEPEPDAEEEEEEGGGEEEEGEETGDGCDADNAGDETETEPELVVTPKKQIAGCSTADDDSGAATGLLFLARSA